MRNGMEDIKKDMLKQQMNCFIENVLNLANREGNLDHIFIEISNDLGELNMKYALNENKENIGERRKNE